MKIISLYIGLLWGRSQSCAYPKVPSLKELRASRISYPITNSVRKMKSTTCLDLKSPLRKRGVERVKLKTEDYFPDREFDMDLA